MPVDNLSSLSANVAQQIKEMIRTHALQPGQQIPTEQQLSERLNVSRSTVREAVKTLVAQNVLEIHRGKGTFVCQLTGLSDDPFGCEFLSKDTVVQNLSEFRILLEPQVVALAAVRATPKELASMLRIVTAMEELFSQNQVEDGLSEEALDRAADLDLKFHTLLYSMTHNPILVRITPYVVKSLIESFTYSDFRKSYRRNYRLSTHRQIYEALKNHDGETASQLCRQHMQTTLLIATHQLHGEPTTMC